MSSEGAGTGVGLLKGRGEGGPTMQSESAFSSVGQIAPVRQVQAHLEEFSARRGCAPVDAQGEQCHLQHHTDDDESSPSSTRRIMTTTARPVSPARVRLSASGSSGAPTSASAAILDAPDVLWAFRSGTVREPGAAGASLGDPRSPGLTGVLRDCY